MIQSPSAKSKPSLLASSALELRRLLRPQRTPTVIEFANRAGVPLDPWQADLLRSGHRRQLALAHRQAGKSSVIAVRSVHTLLYQPGSLTLILSPSLRQSQETFRKALDLFHALDQRSRPEAESSLHLEYEGGRIISLPGTREGGTIRGYSAVKLLCLDEASRIPDEVLFSALPMLAPDGIVLAGSTPAGQRGWFYEEWIGENDWERVFLPATASTRFSAAQLAEQRGIMGEYFYRQEWLCDFVEGLGSVFSPEAIAAAFRSDVLPLWGDGFRADVGTGGPLGGFIDGGTP